MTITIDTDRNVEIQTSYIKSFQWKLDPRTGKPITGYCGFGFDCDEYGNVDVSSLPDCAVENYNNCINGTYNVIDLGVKSHTTETRLCSCGSLLHPEAIYDARGIYVAQVCDKCKEQRLTGFRKDIFEDSNYWTDEPVDEK